MLCPEASGWSLAPGPSHRPRSLHTTFSHMRNVYGTESTGRARRRHGTCQSHALSSPRPLPPPRWPCSSARIEVTTRRSPPYSYSSISRESCVGGLTDFGAWQALLSLVLAKLDVLCTVQYEYVPWYYFHSALGKLLSSVHGKPQAPSRRRHQRDAQGCMSSGSYCLSCAK